MSLKPWVRGPFELLLHGEIHHRSDGDFDRRIALISFDNSIEVSVATYLSLHPSLRGGRTYKKEDIERWSTNFHTKLDFIDIECESRQAFPRIDREYLVWYHDQRNEQYHGGKSQTPSRHDLEGIREAAFWVFTMLFDVHGLSEELETELYLMTKEPEPEVEQSKEFDELIDQYYEEVTLAGGTYRMSEVLYQVDPKAYQEQALELLSTEPEPLRVVS